MRISDWSSDVCSSDLSGPCPVQPPSTPIATAGLAGRAAARIGTARPCPLGIVAADANRLLPRPPNDRRGADGPDAVIPKWRVVGCERLGIGSNDRKSVVCGKRVTVDVDLGGRRSNNKN